MANDILQRVQLSFGELSLYSEVQVEQDMAEDITFSQFRWRAINMECEFKNCYFRAFNTKIERFPCSVR